MVTATALREVNQKKWEILFRCKRSDIGKRKTLEIQKVNHEKVKFKNRLLWEFLLFLLFSSRISKKSRLRTFFQQLHLPSSDSLFNMIILK